MTKHEFYKTFCQKRKEEKKERILQEYSRDFNVRINQQGEIIDFITNDYLNLSKDSRLIQASQQYGEKYGVGSGSSRLLNFKLEIYKEFEEEIAKCKKKEVALIVASGYQTNSTVLSALLNKKVLQEEPLVFCDRLNHASLHHACNLAGIRQIRYNHCDLNHLSILLEKERKSSRPKFIVTETVFSMDGDYPNLRQLASLAKLHNCLLYVDEAHATGIFGYGMTSSLEEEYIDCFDVIMGTFSKGLGVYGSYIATSKMIRDYLVQSCSGFIYSTSLPPNVIGAARSAWQIINEEETKKSVSDLLSRADYLYCQLKENGHDVHYSGTQILNIRLDTSEEVMSIASELRKNNILVAPIRPPTVPSNRLRINLNLAHNDQSLAKLIHYINNKS